ncbi:MAG: NAD(P)H-binding protein [Bifidobacteriaceae bacterium]|jgi:putative NADH-flavin reductase|nr:NAD(P)H-binding protein [Bifidobacteriaceae bacterium]
MEIAVIGGTGYAGAAVVAEAARRGHQVRSVSRNRPAAQAKGVAHLAGSAADPAFLEAAVAEVDAVVSSLSPRGPMLGQVRRVNQQLIALAETLGFRLGVILGGGSLAVAPGGPLLVDTPDFPDFVRPESLEMSEVLDDLRASPAGVDWFGVSPAVGFGAHAPGERLGRYRLGGDTVLADAAGNSFVSAPDLALAIVDELERPAHKRQRFTVAY